MKRLVRNIPRLAAAALAAASCKDSSGPSDIVETDQAIVTFAFSASPQDTMRVEVHDPTTIAQALNYIATHQGPKFPIGPIVRGAGVDSRYPFHFDPDSVKLAEVAIELCDGAPMHTLAEVNTFIQGATGDANAPRATWCPWGAYPIKVEQ